MTEIVHAPAWLPDPRRGTVRPSGKSVFDDTGFFHPLGLTMFWAYQGWTRDRDRFKANISFLRQYNYDHVRIAGQVTWPGWEINPDDPAYESTMAEIIDFLYDENALRTELFLVGDTGPVGIGLQIAEKIARVSSGRAHKFMSIESTNENHIPVPDMIASVRHLLTNTSIPLIALTSPGDETALREAYAQSGATEFTVHTERGGGTWREVRQGRDLARWPGVVNSNEPVGVHSSITSQTDPRVLAMLRANCLIGRAAKFCLHIGDMVTGLGEPARDRKPNLWEIDNIDTILRTVRRIDQYFPAGCENWESTSQHGGTELVGPHPLLSDGIWSDGSDHGVDRAYGLTDGSRFVEVLNGVLDHATLIPRARMDVSAVDPLTGQTYSATLDAGQAWVLPGDATASLAYIVHGIYL